MKKEVSPKKKKVLKILRIILIVLLAFYLLGAIFSIFDKKDEKSVQTKNSSTIEIENDVQEKNTSLELKTLGKSLKAEDRFIKSSKIGYIQTNKKLSSVEQWQDFKNDVDKTDYSYVIVRFTEDDTALRFIPKNSYVGYGTFVKDGLYINKISDVYFGSDGIEDMPKDICR